MDATIRAERLESDTEALSNGTQEREGLIMLSHEILIRDSLPKDVAVLTIGPDAPLKTAMSIMMLEGVEQLPVVSARSKSKVLHGYVGWNTIGESYALGKEPQKVRDCMTKKGLAVVYDNTPLLNVVAVIGRKGFIVVRNEEDEFCGVITRGDVVRYLNEMFKPFARAPI